MALVRGLLSRKMARGASSYGALTQASGESAWCLVHSERILVQMSKGHGLPSQHPPREAWTEGVNLPVFIHQRV